MRNSVHVRSGALSVLAAGFLLSAALRAGDVVAGLPVVADDGFGNRVAVPEPASESPSKPDGSVPELALELRDRAVNLEEREVALEVREQSLAEAERKLRARLEELKALKLEVESGIERTQSAATEDVRHLAAMYETMKPKQAGRIFDEMDPSFAAGFLGEIRPDTAALILSNMSPPKAYAVSLLLAGRNAE